jgi:hypothetical protein
MRTLGHRSDAAALLHESVDRRKPTGNPSWLDMAYRSTHSSGLDVVSIRGLLRVVQACSRRSTRFISSSRTSTLARFEMAPISWAASWAETSPEAAEATIARP